MCIRDRGSSVAVGVGVGSGRTMLQAVSRKAINKMLRTRTDIFMELLLTYGGNYTLIWEGERICQKRKKECNHLGGKRLFPFRQGIGRHKLLQK
jgi:hypothetical protein